MIEIGPTGWRVLDRHDLPFVRTPAMQALPDPESGGMIEALRRFVNASDDDAMLVTAWLLASLAPRGPYPILIVNGEQGSGKSTFSTALRSLIDPNKAPTRAPPEKVEDLIVSGRNAHMIALDNLSHVGGALSDALCRMASGGGAAARAKYTDDDEHVVWVRNPILLNGIPSLVERPDLGRRALIVHLRTIPEEARRPEDEFWPAWNAVRPQILGALCDALSCALRRLPDVRLAGAPSMADFFKLIVAATPGLGWEPGAFEAAYDGNRRDLTSAAVEADAVATAILRLFREDYPSGWTGTATELLTLLNEKVDPSLWRSRAWPDTAQKLGNRIERAKPLLREHGVIVERHHSGQRFVSIAPKI